MPSLMLRRLAAVTLALGTAFGWTPAAHAAGAINIASCQTLSIPNTTYKLTANLTSCGDCLIVAANKITIDLQGHSIITNSTCPGAGAAITDLEVPRDLTVVKNGSVANYSVGISLPESTRASVIGVESTGNSQYGIWTGTNSLVKSSTAKNNGQEGIIVDPNSQVQQSNAEFNKLGILTSHYALITMNITSNNRQDGIRTRDHATVTFNTANNNGGHGISAGGDNGGSASLVSQNTAMGNGQDFFIECPSDVTFNTSTLGFPASYLFTSSPACHTANNQ